MDSMMVVTADLMMVVTANQIADDLDDTADLIERDGWIQGSYVTAEGYCTVGALGCVTSSRRELSRLYRHRRMWLALNSLMPRIPVGMGVADWNDESDRTEQQVLDLLRATAKDLRRWGEDAA